MFRVQDTILSEDIATAKFACDVTRCKGACCVVGDAGAPVGKEEIPALKKAFRLLRDELNPAAVELVEKEGLVSGDKTKGYELTCVDDKECVFVTFNEQGVAECAIQKAYFEGRIGWEKPISCHLFPVRLKRVIDFDYANYEYIPDLCSTGCEHGEEEGIWLSDFLEEALVRRYGREWYERFLEACTRIREREAEANANIKGNENKEEFERVNGRESVGEDVHMDSNEFVIENVKAAKA